MLMCLASLCCAVSNASCLCSWRKCVVFSPDKVRISFFLECRLDDQRPFSHLEVNPISVQKVQGMISTLANIKYVKFKECIYFSVCILCLLANFSLCPAWNSAKQLLLFSTDESYTGLTHEAKQMMAIFSFRLTIYMHDFTTVVLSKALQVTFKRFLLPKMHCK